MFKHFTVKYRIVRCGALNSTHSLTSDRVKKSLVDIIHLRILHCLLSTSGRLKLCAQLK